MADPNSIPGGGNLVYRKQGSTAKSLHYHHAIFMIWLEYCNSWKGRKSQVIYPSYDDSKFKSFFCVDLFVYCIRHSLLFLFDASNGDGLWLSLLLDISITMFCTFRRGKTLLWQYVVCKLTFIYSVGLSLVIKIKDDDITNSFSLLEDVNASYQGVIQTEASIPERMIRLTC